jgi:hypothetical protein
VIGDKSGGFSSARLSDGISPLVGLLEVVDVPVKIIHVKRHPLDNISTMARKGFGNNIDEAIQRYFEDCETIIGVRKWVQKKDEVDWIDILQENFVRETEKT